MNIIRLGDRIKQAEGFRMIPYKCPLGVWTVSWGVTNWLGKKISPLMRPSHELCEAMFNHHFVQAAEMASMYVGNYHKLDDIRQEALIEMAYQLGGWKQRKFVNLRSAIQTEQWEYAWSETIDSLWFDQTPDRCKRIADMLKLGQQWLNVYGDRW